MVLQQYINVSLYNLIALANPTEQLLHTQDVIKSVELDVSPKWYTYHYSVRFLSARPLHTWRIENNLHAIERIHLIKGISCVPDNVRLEFNPSSKTLSLGYGIESGSTLKLLRSKADWVGAKKLLYLTAMMIDEKLRPSGLYNGSLSSHSIVLSKD